MATNWVNEARPRLSELESLTTEEWEELWKKLRLFTWRRYGSLRGIDLDDVIQQAIVDALEGRRRWPKQEVSLFQFLCGVIRSRISHLLERQRRIVPIESLKPGLHAEDEGSDAASLERSINEPIGEYLRYEAIYNRGFYDLLVDTMCESVEGDGELVNIVRLWSKDPRAKPREIAQQLGLSMDAMRNAQKRLRRKLQTLREK
jgi:DNA-directed RNA polymerase specialized sigma24 family protein